MKRVLFNEKVWGLPDSDKRARKESIRDLSVMLGGLVAVCSLAIFTTDKLVVEPRQKIEANDARRTPEQDAVCTRVEFSTDDTGADILRVFPDYYKASNPEYRLRAITDLAPTDPVPDDTVVTICDVDASYTNDDSRVEARSWDMYLPDQAAGHEMITPDEFAQHLEPIRS